MSYQWGGLQTQNHTFCTVPFLSLSFRRAGPFNFFSSEQTAGEADENYQLYVSEIIEK